MKYEVEVSEQADRDLREIFEYIAFELQSLENAIGQLDRLEEQIFFQYLVFDGENLPLPDSYEVELEERYQL